MISDRRERIQLIDAVRGLAVVLMVLHHFLYDLVVFLGAPAWLFSNPVFNFLQYIFAGVFIVLSGISSRFSRSNIKRGIRVLVLAFLLTVVTTYLGFMIRFGILHLLGFCMVFYGLTHRITEGAPRTVSLPLFAAFAVISALAVNLIHLDTRLLWMFGWTYPGFFSADYYPIFPWLFVFLCGTVIGGYITEHRFPQWFYEKNVPFFPFAGRHALIIYILHQPVLYGITALLGPLFGRNIW